AAPAGHAGPAPAPAAAAGGHPGQPAAAAGQVHFGVDGRPYAPPAKSKGIAVLLCLLLGGFGGHNLYLGHYGRGAGQAALTLVAYPVLLKIGMMPLAVLGVAPAVALWVIVELILILAGAGGYRGQLRPQPIGPADGVG
ncbi:NINE protein, partial [Corynebacterium sphenisci]|uniref:NINE protein n=1 Tax=Corynebacterium sphenisci TaxID=191493 RepID=UPI0026DFAB13